MRKSICICSHWVHRCELGITIALYISFLENQKWIICQYGFDEAIPWDRILQKWSLQCQAIPRNSILLTTETFQILFFARKKEPDWPNQNPIPSNFQQIKKKKCIVPNVLRLAGWNNCKTAVKARHTNFQA